MLLLLANTTNRVVISAILGVVTGVVDFFIHEGMFGPEAAEAAVTGLGAAVLSHVLGTVAACYKFIKQKLASLT